MCGINGIFSFSDRVVPLGEDLISRMNEQIRHRGPDDSGTWFNPAGRVFLGHQRLSILDLSSEGHQPMLAEDRRTAVVFNGEIYNYQELKKETSPLSYHSSTDTEVLLNLYQVKGDKLLQELRGMFAFAIWDENKNQLFLARDRAGQKPLYYVEKDGIFAFSSELRSLLLLPWVEKELDYEALYHFLTYNHMVPPYTMFKGIRKFEPGHKMIVGKEGIKLYEPYWTIRLNAEGGRKLADERDLEEEVFSTLETALSYRMISDVPVGAFLSGGVDSSVIVAMMSQRSTHAVKTFSIGFEGQADYDELQYAAQVAGRYRTNHFEKIVNPQDFQEMLPRMVEVFDEPLADATCIPIYFLSQLAAENDIKVVLTGDGADELFAGYNNWKKYVEKVGQFNRYSALPSPLKKAIASAYGVLDSKSPLHEMLVRAALNQDFFWSGARGIRENQKKSFLSPHFLQQVKGCNSYSIIEQFRQAYNHANPDEIEDYVNWLCFTGFKNVIPNLYLHRLDRLSMAHSVEGRSPFMDHKLVELAFSIEGNLKIRNGQPKYILKKSLEKLLPHEVLYRKKQGFCVPLKEWGSAIMEDYLVDNYKQFCADFPIFKSGEIEKLIRSLQRDEAVNINKIWTIYFLMNWLKRWM